METQSTWAGGFRLILQQAETGCLLQAERKSSVLTFPLALSAPCFFISGKEGVHVESYPDWDIQAVIIMAGGTLPPTTRAA